MTSSETASHPYFSEMETRDDPNGANAAIAKRHIGAASRRKAGSPFLPL
ncbi:hypothetical protein IQ277_15560 [Nostocales cyanobacterium LEGE 12452]|nr:hypothetical protein [Nostocales cyanobacterium LEGE 12452]